MYSPGRNIIRNKAFLIYNFKKLYFEYYNYNMVLFNKYTRFVMNEFRKITIDNISRLKLKDLIDVINHYAIKYLSEVAKKYSINNINYIHTDRFNKKLINTLSNMVCYNSLFSRIYINTVMCQKYINKGCTLEEMLFDASPEEYHGYILSFDVIFNHKIRDIELTDDEIKEKKKEYAIREWSAWGQYDERYDYDIIDL